MTTENKYQRGKIYKIISNQTEDVYFGSTIEIVLSNRLAKHRNNYRSWLEEKFPYLSSFEILKHDNARIVLVESFPCTSRYELIGREQFYIDNNECVNKHKAYSGLDKKHYQQKYRDDHRVEAKEYNAQYRKDNRERKIQKDRQYYNDIVKNKRVVCDCGGNYMQSYKLAHQRTRMHRVYEMSIVGASQNT